MPKSEKFLAKHGDKLDKYRKHLFEASQLADTDQLMLERYRKAWSFMAAGHSREQTVNMLCKEYRLSLPQCYVTVRDAIQLYGDVAETNKKGLRQLMYEQFMAAADLARINGDYNAMIRAMENAAKIMDVYNPEESAVDPKTFMSPVAIIFTTDPRVLREQQTQDAEYEPFEE